MRLQLKYLSLMYLIFSTLCFAEDLQIELHIYESIADENMNNVQVMLINISKSDITVLSKGLGQVKGRISKNPHFNISLSPSKSSWKEYNLVQSLTTFSPVTLRPNEATLYYVFQKPFNSPFHELKDDIEKLSVTYNISKEFGERHNIWYGSATSKEYPVLKNQVQPLAE